MIERCREGGGMEGVDDAQHVGVEEEGGKRRRGSRRRVRRGAERGGKCFTIDNEIQMQKIQTKQRYSAQSEQTDVNGKNFLGSY